jgi:hypothetical protein
LSESAKEAFEELKRRLCTAPVLVPPDFHKTFYLHTDASDYAVGAVLLQDFGQGLQPVAFESSKLTEVE